MDSSVCRAQEKAKEICSPLALAAQRRGKVAVKGCTRGGLTFNAIGSGKVMSLPLVRAQRVRMD